MRNKRSLVAEMAWALVLPLICLTPAGAQAPAKAPAKTQAQDKAQAQGQTQKQKQAQAPVPVPVPVLAQDKDKACLECHDDIAKKVVSHKSCTGCHANFTSPTPPHTPAGKSAKEVAAAGPGMCMACHDKKMFEGKVVHGPVAIGQCLLCHNNHASDQVALLKTNPVALCLDCHPDVKTGGHRFNQFSGIGHPLGNGNRQVDDPSRPGKKFYCAACHEPHRSERAKLTRFGKEMDSCLKCHKI